MTRTVWLACYPMSGATWLHVFLTSLLAKDVSTDITFIKVHCAYTPLGANGSTQQDAPSAIVVVRDPRDIALSLAAYSRGSIDDSVALMDNPDAVPAASDQPSQRTLTRWSHHVASWLEQKHIPVHLVRYEDLVADPSTSFRRVLRFTGIAAGEDAIRRAIASSDFKEPVTRGSEKRLVHRIGGWRDELTAAQTARIEAHHGAMMQRLGYTPSSRLKIANSTR